MKKGLLCILLVLSMALLVPGMATRVDAGILDIYLAANGSVVGIASESSSADDINIDIYMSLEESRTITLDLQDIEEDPASDTIVTCCGSEDFELDEEEAYSISGNVITVYGDMGNLCVAVSSEELGVTAYAYVNYYTDDYLEDMTSDYIVYCNDEEVTSTTTGFFNTSDMVQVWYSIDVEVGGIYILEIVDRATGEICSFYDWDYIEESGLGSTYLDDESIVIFPSEAGFSYLWMYDPYYFISFNCTGSSDDSSEDSSEDSSDDSSEDSSDTSPDVSDMSVVKTVEIGDQSFGVFLAKFTDSLEIVEGQELVITGTVYNGEELYETLLFALYSSDDGGVYYWDSDEAEEKNFEEHFFGRADAFGWGEASYTTTIPDDWDEWSETVQAGAKFTLTVTYLDGNIQITCSCEGAGLVATYPVEDESLTYYIVLTGDYCKLKNVVATYYVDDSTEETYTDLEDCSVTLAQSSYTYDGSAKTPTVTVTYNGTTLTKGTDYTVTYSNNTDAGTATVTVTGCGNYTGTVTKNFTINKASQMVSVTTTGSTSLEVGDTTTWKAAGSDSGTITYSSSDTSVATVSSSGKVTAVSAGSVKIYATAAATTNYNASSKTLIATITVTEVKLATCSVSYINNTMYGLKVVWGKVAGASGYYIYIRNDDGTYNSTPTATVAGGDTTEWTDTRDLTGGKDYTYKVAAYYKSSDGTITVGATGTTKTCKYLKWGVVESVTNVSSGLKVTWTKVAGANGYYIFRKSSSDSDYTQVATVSGSSVVSWTDTSSLASGKNYTYKVSAIFTNSKGQVTKGGALTTKTAKYLTAGKISSLTNTSTGITVKWSKVSGASGYYVYRKASSASSYTLVKTITSVGTVSYTDTAVKSKNGTTYTYYVIPYYKNSSGAVTKGAYSATKKTVRLTAVSLSSVKNSSSKKMTVKWAKNSKATGYEIQYSTSSSFASGNKTVTVSSASTVSKVISSLTKGKTYYVRVRAYKTVSGTKYYSAWSTKKSVKISK